MPAAVPRLASDYRPARRNLARINGWDTWRPRRGPLRRYHHPAVRANKRDRSPQSMWRRLNPFTWQREGSVATRLISTIMSWFGPAAFWRK